MATISKTWWGQKFLEALKDFKKALNNVEDDDNDNDEWGGIFKSRNKSKPETTEEENEYKLFEINLDED